MPCSEKWQIRCRIFHPFVYCSLLLLDHSVPPPVISIHSTDCNKITNSLTVHSYPPFPKHDDCPLRVGGLSAFTWLLYNTWAWLYVISMHCSLACQHECRQVVTDPSTLFSNHNVAQTPISPTCLPQPCRRHPGRLRPLFRIAVTRSLVSCCPSTEDIRLPSSHKPQPV